MKYFIDTEFIELGPGRPIYLLSLGMVAEDGREFYAVWDAAPRKLANDWVRANVLPHVGMIPTARAGATDQESAMANAFPPAFIITPYLNNIAECILTFVGQDRNLQFWGYYSDYDWVVFCQIFGTMVDLPKGWPMYCRDLKQWCDQLGNPTLPEQFETEHHALFDARWNKRVYQFLKDIEEEQRANNQSNVGNR